MWLTGSMGAPAGVLWPECCSLFGREGMEAACCPGSDSLEPCPPLPPTPHLALSSSASVSPHEDTC